MVWCDVTRLLSDCYIYKDMKIVQRLSETCQIKKVTFGLIVEIQSNLKVQIPCCIVKTKNTWIYDISIGHLNTPGRPNLSK